MDAGEVNGALAPGALLESREGKGAALVDGKEDDEADKQTPLRRNAAFVLLWTANASSSFGAAIAALAIPVLALAVTTSAALAGLVGSAGLLALLFFRLPAGVLVDRLSLRPLLAVADGVRAVVAALLVVAVLTSELALWHLIVAAVLTGVCAATADTAFSVAVRHLVPSTQLPRAFALNEGRAHAVSLFGQPAGGVLLALSPAASMGVNALMYCLSAGLVSRIPLRMRAATPGAGSGSNDFLGGVRFLLRDPLLRTILVGVTGYQFVFAGLSFGLIASFGRTAAADPAQLGLMFALGAVGGLIGASVAPYAQRRFPTWALILLMGLVSVASLWGIALTTLPVVAGLCIAAVFAAAAPANAMLLAIQIVRTPSHLQGRVIAGALFLAGIVTPAAPPIVGLALDELGHFPTFACAGLLIALATAYLLSSATVRAAHSG